MSQQNQQDLDKRRKQERKSTTDSQSSELEFLIENRDGTLKFDVLRELGRGGQGISYLAIDQDDKVKVVKSNFVPGSKSVSGLVTQLQQDYRKVNAALGTNYSVFEINGAEFAISSDFIEGTNLKEDIINTNRVYSEEEALDMCLQVVEKALNPLHTHSLVHRDVKPENIIVSKTKEGREYNLIDFGIMREHNKRATITGSFNGSWAYSPPKDVYEMKDDFTSLAKTVYYLLTGQDPLVVEDADLAKISDSTKVGALPIRDIFKSVLMKMLGHHEDSYDAEELLLDLKKVSKGADSTHIGIDLQAAHSLTKYREDTTIPTLLEQRINGLEAIFAEKYDGMKRDREPLDAEFVNELTAVLGELGYECEQDEVTRNIYNYVSLKGRFRKIKTNAFVRKHKDSSRVDIFSIESEGEKYFQHYSTKSDNAHELLEPIQKGNAFATFMRLVGGCGGIIGTAFLAGEATYEATNSHALSVVAAFGGLVLGSVSGGKYFVTMEKAPLVKGYIDTIGGVVAAPFEPIKHYHNARRWVESTRVQDEKLLNKSLEPIRGIKYNK